MINLFHHTIFRTIRTANRFRRTSWVITSGIFLFILRLTGWLEPLPLQILSAGFLSTLLIETVSWLYLDLPCERDAASAGFLVAVADLQIIHDDLQKITSDGRIPGLQFLCWSMKDTDGEYCAALKCSKSEFIRVGGVPYENGKQTTGVIAGDTLTSILPTLYAEDVLDGDDLVIQFFHVNRPIADGEIFGLEDIIGDRVLSRYIFYPYITADLPPEEDAV